MGTIDMIGESDRRKPKPKLIEVSLQDSAVFAHTLRSDGRPKNNSASRDETESPKAALAENTHVSVMANPFGYSILRIAVSALP